ncbi:MAG: hypothetical protein HQK49_02860 [Oligoflexia bacterium]|nr:hypothetical protein [Oligoflexia bacterium]
MEELTCFAKNVTKTYIIDTSFLIKSFEEGSEDYEICNTVRKFIFESEKITAIYNTTIRAELLKYVRKVLITSFLNSNQNYFSQEIISIKKREKKLTVNNLINHGLIDVFSEAFGETGQFLVNQLNIITDGVIFYSPSQNTKRSKLWQLLPEIMAKFGLDSGDAMILNIALSTKGINGLITADREFRFCETGKNFDIFMPKRHITGSLKSWRKHGK